MDCLKIRFGVVPCELAVFCSYL